MKSKSHFLRPTYLSDMLYVVCSPVVLFIIFTGMSVSYWGPIAYTFAIFCIMFAFYFSFSSKFVTDDKVKLSFFFFFLIGLYIIAISMIIQWVNRLGWILLFSVPNYSYIIENFIDLIKPAFSSIGWFVPIISAPAVFKFCFMKVNDTKDLVDSIFELKTILDYYDNLYNDFEKEKISKKMFEEYV